MKIINENNPKITFSTPTLFVDHEKNFRSGHLGHALAECKDGSLLAFYSNCSGTIASGHSMCGWTEYRRSTDRGNSWGEPEILKYSYDSFKEGTYKIGCEKAVVCDDGTVVLFCLRSIGKYFEPYASPVYLTSNDNGKTWSKPHELTQERGRIYDAVYRDGRIYALMFCYSTDEGFTCEVPNKFYKIFASDNNGNSFYEYSTIPFNTLHHAYGNMIFRADGSLVFYSYNEKDEYNLTCLISDDLGKTWGKPFKSYVAKIARNPQVGCVNGHYICHGRSEGGENFVFYHSKDAVTWDNGTIVNGLVKGANPGACYYSNNLTISDENKTERMLVQYSEQYERDDPRVNVMHAWVYCE